MLRLLDFAAVVSLGIQIARGFEQSDTVVVGQTFLAGSSDPTEGSAGWALTSHGIAEKLFTVDKDGEIVGQLAKSVSKVSEYVWDVVLKPDSKFSDGTVVDASHVAMALTELNSKNDAAKTSLGEMTVTAPGDLMVRIESTSPTHVMDAVLAEWVFVVFMKDATDNFVFTGPYAIQKFTEAQIDLVPNQYFPQASERPLVTLKKVSDAHELAEGVKKNEIDIAFHLPIDTLPELRQTQDVVVKSFEVGYHYMAFHNMDAGRLDDLRVRKAIDIAIDRTALSQALAGGTGTRSLFPDYSPYYVDETSKIGDAGRAKELLDEAGWLLDDNSGMRMKDGKPLTINLVAYPHRPGLKTMQPVIEAALEALGMDVTSIVTGQDWSETQTILNDRSFDLMMWAQHTLPAGDPYWFLNNFFRSDMDSNYAGLASDEVDTLLDKLSVAEDHKVRVDASGAAMIAILDEVPVSNLVTPFWHVGLSKRMADYEPYGSDYYVIRPDLFVSKSPVDPEPETPNDPTESGASCRVAGGAVLSTLSVLAMTA